MNFEINRLMHPNVETIDHIPPQHQNTYIKGAFVHCLQGDFCLLINQTIPSDSWRICMHHFFFASYTWIQYPANEIYPLILFNYGKELKIYTYVGPGQPVKLCGNEFLGKKAFNILAGDYALFPAACDKGEYHFFSIAGHLHQVETIIQNPILRDAIFPELIEMLTVIGKKLKL
jgi:hypothetical protein